MLESGASPSVRNTYGHDTPLHAAACFGHLHCVLELLQYTADPRAANRAGLTPGLVAQANGHPECAMMLKMAADATA